MNPELISIEAFCVHHHTEITFIDALEQNGLIEVIHTETLPCIHADQLWQLERFVTLYKELEVNIPGIEVVQTLLDKVSQMQHKILELENKVRFYEG
jgi:chaperone modulatory protein CbpM